MVRLLPVLLASCLLLAGCSDSPSPGATGDGSTSDGACDPAAAGCPDQGALTADSSVPAPTWAVGQWWEWEPAGASGTGAKFRSVVLEAGASGATVGTDSPGRAKQQAAFDHILIGAITPSLGATAWGGAWDLLSFPLTSGKTWTTTIPNIAWDVYFPDTKVEVAMRADFDEALQGFTFMGHVGDDMVLEGTYLPATGWYGELVVYDVDPEQDPLEFSYTAVAAGLNHTGAAYSATAEVLLTLHDANGFTDVPTEGGQPIVQAPDPYGSFSMGDGTTLYGVLHAEAVAGGRVITLTDPQNEQRQVAASGTPEGEEVLWIDEPGIAGQWHVATSGAGGFSFAVVALYEVTLTETAL